MRECLNQCADERLHYCCCEQEPTNHPGWCNALVYLFHTTGTRDPRLRLVHPMRAKQDAHTGPRVTPDGLHLHIGGYRRRGGLSPITRRAAYHPPASLMYIFQDILAESEYREPNADVAWPEPLRLRPDAPTLVWLVTTDDQCTRAVQQAQLQAEWVMVQVGAGQPRPRGLPRGTPLLVAAGVPHDPHMAVHVLEDQPEDTGHLVVHQRRGPAWLKEHVMALRSWASTIAGADIRLHDHPAISPGDTRALSVDQLTPTHPDVGWDSADLNARWLSPTGYYWIAEAWGHTSSDASGGGPCKHAISVALAADLTNTWAVAISGTMADREGVAASLPLQYGAHRPWVHTVDAEVILHLLRHADREHTTGVPAVGAGQPRPRGLPCGTALLVAAGVPHDPHMAVHALEDQPEDTGHLLVHLRGGPVWLKEHVMPLWSWASTIAGAHIRLHDHPAISPGDTRALSVDQLTPTHPDVGWHSADLNARWLSPTGYYWIPEAWGHTSSDAWGGGPCKHAISVALAADLTHTWAVAISGTVPDREGVAASLPLQYGAH